VNNALAGLFTDAAQVAPHALDTIVTLLGNSIAVGAVLAVTTYLVARVSRLPFGKKPDGVDESAIEYRLQQFVGSATLLLLCVGLTSLMLVINNSIVRAFALMAAVSLVRFRVRLDRKDASGASLMSAAMLFAVLIGVASGLNELTLSWVLTGLYALLMALFAVIVGRLFSRAQRASPSR